MLQIYILCLWILLSMPGVGTFFFIDINSTDYGMGDSDGNLTDLNVTHPWFENNDTSFDWNFINFDPNYTGSNLYFPADSEMNWVVEIHLIHCGLDTLCNTYKIPQISNNSEFWEKCSGTCSCNESCLTDQGQGCCPDVYPKLDPPVQEPSLAQCVPVIFPLNVYTPLNQMQPRTLIIKCPDNTTESMNEIALKCHKDYWQLWESGLQEYAIPVTDRSNLNHHYKNVFCALCHGKEKSELIFWQIQILFDIVFLPQLESDISLMLEDLWSLINRHFNFLYLQFQPPATVPDESVACYINTCNLTEQWKSYNNVTERACHLYTHGYNNTFANIFCSICNGIEFGTYLSVFPYTLLIDVNGHEALTELHMAQTLSDTCAAGYYDPIYKTCREVRCNLMFLPENNQCITTVRDVQGFLFRTDIYFKLTTPQKLTSDFWHNINSSFTARADEVIKEINTTRGFELEILHINYGHIVNVSYTLDNQGEPIIHDADITHFAFTLKIKLRQKRISGSQTVKYLINSINLLHQCHTYSNLLKNQMECTSVYILNFLVPQNIDLDMMNKVELMFSFYQFKMQQTQLENANILSPIASKPDLSSYQHMSIFTETLFNQKPTWMHIFILINHTCPLLVFYKNEYIITRSGIHFPLPNKTLPYVYVVNVGKGLKQISVCMEVYNALIVEDHDQMRQDSSPTSPSTIVSALCSGLSVLFLTITIIYYSCIHVPQMMPGWMLMLLCISLLLTQLLSILISSLHISSRLCQVLALTLHFCQLTYLFWMNVSTYHLYKACTNDPHRSTVSGSVPLWYIVYVYSGATVFVLLNIAVQLVTSQGKDIGYGGAWCFISTTYMAGITLLLPLSAVLCASIVMTSLVILRTPLQPDINIVQKSCTKWIQTFLKLSALSSLTWLFDCVHHWTNLDVFFYVYTALNTSQGLFIFWAFVLIKTQNGFKKKVNLHNS